MAQPAPTDIPEAAREALVESTRRQHLNYCKMVAKEINPDQPIDRALVSALQRLAAQRGWRKGTQLKVAAGIQGAFKILPLYFMNTASILLKDFPVWRMSLVTYGHRSKQELPVQPKAASWEQVSHAVRACKNDGQAMALLIGWLTAARLGCVRQLSRGDVKWSAQHTLVRFSKGKSARIRGPYTVHAQPVPREFRDRWKSYFESRQTALFPRHVTGNSLKEALRHIDPELEQRSIRRGALQAMALCDVDEETLMRCRTHASQYTAPLPQLERHELQGSEGDDRGWQTPGQEAQKVTPPLFTSFDPSPLSCPKWSELLPHRSFTHLPLHVKKVACSVRYGAVRELPMSS